MDFAQFNAYHTPALEREEAKHCLILSLMARAAIEEPPGQTQKWSFGEPGACAVRTQGRGLVLGALTRDQCRQLAQEVAGTRFNSVLGPDDTALWVVERAKELGERFKQTFAQRIHALSRPPRYPGAAGYAHPVMPGDMNPFAEWYRAFVAEAAPEDQPPSHGGDRTQGGLGRLPFLDGGRPARIACRDRPAHAQGGGDRAGLYTAPNCVAGAMPVR